MRTVKLALVALLAFGTLAAGCGRAPETGSPSFVREQVIGAKLYGKAVVVAKDQVRPEPSPLVAVMIDGQAYPKGQTPEAKVTPAPEAPEAGRGHLHLKVSLSGTTSFTEALRFAITKKGETEPAYVFEVPKTDIKGLTLSLTATNLAPGAYVVTRESVNQSEKVFKRATFDAVVEADATSDAAV